jgi:hypothetical protein
MQNPRTSSSPRPAAERQAEYREFWDRRPDGSTEPRKAAFADTVTSFRKRLGKRKQRP